ncbi:MAG: ABC transporter permease [Thermomicrobiales bacterium]
MSSTPSRARNCLVTGLGPIAAVVAALFVGGLLIAITGSDPWEAYRALFDRAFNGRRAIGETGIYAAPLILGGLAFSVAFRAGMFNVGVEGQLMIGGFAAGLVAALDLGLPAFVHIPLGLLAALVAGGIYGFIPGFLRATRGAHEVITTIMLNYLCFRLLNYLIQKSSGWLPVATQSNGTERAQPEARLPIVFDGTRLHFGFVIAIIAAIVLWYVFARTTLGYKIRTVGLSSGAAAYGGISWKKTIIIAMLLSGAVAGLAGAGEAMGLHGRMYGTPTGYGFTAIAVGLVGRNHPIAIIFSGLLFGALSAGAPGMQSAGVSKEIVSVLQGLIILAVAAFEVAGRIPGIRKFVAPPPSAVGPDRSSDDDSDPDTNTTRPSVAI